MAKYKINHTHLTTDNPQRLIDFYTGVMGGKIVQEVVLTGNNKAYDIDLGGLLIRVSSTTGADTALAKEYTAAKGRYHWSLHHIAMTVDDMDEAYAELKAKGAQFVVPPTETRPGSKVAFMVAPDNVLFELIWRKQ